VIRERVRDQNINTPEYWDGVYAAEEDGRIATWRWDMVVAQLEGCRSILDVGGGKGDFLAWLNPAKFNRRVVLDQSGVAIRCASEAGLEAWVGSCYALPFGSGEFDAVTIQETLEHIDDPEAAIREAARIAQSAIVVSVPLLRAVDHEEHIWSYSSKAVRELLRPYGQVTVEVMGDHTIIAGVRL
jgi:ubiquinone/menaquinone biosynthesis C-methylase UbiE